MLAFNLNDVSHSYSTGNFLRRTSAIMISSVYVQNISECYMQILLTFGRGGGLRTNRLYFDGDPDYLDDQEKVTRRFALQRVLSNCA